MSTQTEDRATSRGDDSTTGQNPFDQFRDQFIQRVADKGVASVSCPICTHDSWEMVGGTTADTFTGWASQPSGTLRAIPIICDHCGFIAYFAAKLYDIKESR